MRYSLRQLEVFLATARYENVTRAAAGAGHVPVRRQRLAQRTGKPVRCEVVRPPAASGLQLSELGRQLRPQAESLLEQARALEQALAGEEVIGRLQIGATLTIGNYIAVNMIADFRQHYPAGGYRLAGGQYRDDCRARGQLRAGHGSYRRRTATPGPGHRALAARRTGGVRRARASAGTGRAPSPTRTCWRCPGSCANAAPARARHSTAPCTAFCTDLHIAMELQHTEAIKRAVEAGLGVGCLSRICLAEAFKRGSLVPLAVPGRDFRREWFLITHREKFHSAALKQWLALCLERWAA